jgi:hypothetical protein
VVGMAFNKSWLGGMGINSRITNLLFGSWRRTVLIILTVWSLGGLARWHFILSGPHLIVEQFAGRDPQILAALGSPIEIGNPFDPGRATIQSGGPAEYNGNYASVRLDLYGRRRNALLEAFIKEVPGGWKPVDIALVMKNGERIPITTDQILYLKMKPD